MDTNKINSTKKDKLLKLTISLVNEVNSLQGIVQTLEQCLTLMKKMYEIHETRFGPKVIYTINTLHTHLKELDSSHLYLWNIYDNVKLFNTFRISKLESDIAMLRTI